MKKIVLVFLILLSFGLKAQEIEKTYYEDGTLQSEKTPTGAKVYYKDGKLMSEERLIEDNKSVFKNKTLVKIYWPNGKIMAKLGMIGYDFTNPTKLYYADGKLQIDWIHKKIKNKDDDLFSGTQKVYYKSGKLAEEVEIRNGKLAGKRVSHYPSGKIKTKGIFPEKGYGFYKVFYQNGDLAEKTTFKEGKFISGVRYDLKGREIKITDEELEKLNTLYSLTNIRNKDTGATPTWLLMFFTSDSKAAQKESKKLLDSDFDDGSNIYVLQLITTETIKNIYSK